MGPRPAALCRGAALVVEIALRYLNHPDLKLARTWTWRWARRKPGSFGPWPQAFASLAPIEPFSQGLGPDVLGSIDDDRSNLQARTHGDAVRPRQDQGMDARL